jgi:hypothetical protein
MSRIVVILLALLLVTGIYLPGAESLFASEEAEAKDEWIQDEEKVDDADYQRFMEEVREMEEWSGDEHEDTEEEQSYPDEKYQEDRG